MSCLKCGVETPNPKFCSKSCSVSYNNHLKPKRQKQKRFCIECGVETTGRRKYCQNCFESKWRVKYDQRTLESLRTECGSRNSYLTLVRHHSRRCAREAGKLAQCLVCGYSIYVECCHIKAVADFPIEAMLIEVNHLDNLVGLCPNHHKELDLGLLKLSD